MGGGSLAALGPVAAATAVVAIAAFAIAIAQFLDFRAVDIATGDYSDVAGVAPPPRVESEKAGDAHAYIPLVLALAAIGLLVAAHRGRWQLVRLIAPVGLAVIAISLLVDLPAARDIGAAERDYVDADWVLLSGFWLQLGAAVALVAGALGLAASLKSRRRDGRRIGGSPRAGEGEGAPA